MMSRHPTTTARRAFEPHGGTFTSTPAGGVSWKPKPWPISVALDPHSDVLRICITHDVLERTASPRTSAHIKDLRRTIGAEVHHRGIVTLPAPAQVHRWKAQHLAVVLRAMAGQLPAVKTDTNGPPVARVWIHEWPRRTTPTPLRVIVTRGDYEATLFLLPEAAPILTPLRDVFARWGHLAVSIDEALEALREDTIDARVERQLDRAFPPDTPPPPPNPNEQGIAGVLSREAVAAFRSTRMDRQAHILAFLAVLASPQIKDPESLMLPAQVRAHRLHQRISAQRDQPRQERRR